MAVANVLEALDSQQTVGYKRPSLNNLVIYGKVRCIIERPSFIGKGLKADNGYFAILDTFAIKCLSEDYFKGIDYSVNQLYLTKGSLLIFINDVNLLGKLVKVSGKGKYGVTLRKQNCTNFNEGFSAFMFGKPEKIEGNSVYPLMPNIVYEISSGDKDIKGTVLEEFISEYKNNGVMPYPDDLNSIVSYIAVEDYKEIDVKVIKEQEDKYSNFSTGKIDVSNVPMNLVNHLEGQPRSEYFEPFKEDIVKQSIARQDFVEKTLDEIKKLFDNSNFNYTFLKDLFIENVVKYPSERLGLSTVTCGQYISKFIENCSRVLSNDDESSSMFNMSIKKGIEKLKSGVVVDNTLLYGNTGDSDIDCISMLSDTYAFIVNVISTCCGIDFDKLKKSYNYSCKRMSIDKDLWMFMLLKYPYHLGLLSVGLSVVDCDIIYHSIGKLFEENEEEGYLNDTFRSYLILLNTLDKESDGRFIKISEFRSANIAYPAKNIKNLKINHNPATLEIKSILEMLLNSSIDIDEDEVNDMLYTKWFSNDLFSTLCDAGIINTLDDFCVLERNIEQEFLIYETLEKMGKEETDISNEVIENVIADFEKEKGFKLEELQKQGIKLCQHHAGVLSGCAGSGKTTISDCLTEVIKTLEDVNIIYCTPTGKACRRLAEVVHSNVKTLHSQFGVGIGGSSYLQGAYKKRISSNSNSKNVYILDEMAMCSTDLLYNVVRSISPDDMIYFLGDVKQLPPIGGSCPFKILMTLLPCVELGVSKRASEGSMVNYNAFLINFMSDKVCKELQYDDKTFISEDCSDVEIPNRVKKVFKGFLDGSENGTCYNEDDIQVITGYQKKDKVSSTFMLNSPIQSILRANDRVLYYKNSTINGYDSEPFYQNDRVIYVNKNSYDICRYVYENGIFHQVVTFGCVNGEIGKLVNVIPSDMIKISNININSIKAGEGFYKDISEEELNSLVTKFEAREDSIRDDTSFEGEDLYFVVVKVYDTDLKRDVYVLLRGKGHFVGSDFCLSGVDLNNLNLAYALTCHKMQGSQSKVVIPVFEEKGNPYFINRNMINTMITRSQEVVCCVGSVEGRNSMLNTGRLFKSRVNNKDLLSVLTGSADWIGM